ncbi:helix-turn-helix transcriptional regulator [Adlercreutzia sp. R21]|uniref:Helix-turn-helix transcriptional regulator n=1 Tax=Adlercreutzia wanghongyangiae TaxID=3111451 RepID=A0ABU6IIL5_9ACTN|nr:helix-turn-helix transcriptional regulator [Adlercreutzia sp. R21]MEC4176244.1 helix-turn-helix transcriptional regulator [Adlercreutzia sp. R7]MEC4184326.1 helix-turn-helix transcriptional regulator [Adlercreutzia sp. R21]
MDTARTDPRLAALGMRIRRHRETQNLSQDRLAKMINTDQAYICRIENAQVNPGIVTVFEIADALDVPLNNLLDL